MPLDISVTYVLKKHCHYFCSSHLSDIICLPKALPSFLQQSALCINPSLPAKVFISPSHDRLDGSHGMRALTVCLTSCVSQTANASDRDQDECREAGMDGFLSKPVLKDQLADSITRVSDGCLSVLECWGT